jgi:hypothetical protein
MLTDCGSNVAYNLNKTTVKLNNGYIHLPQQHTVPFESIMDYESSDAALLDREQHHPLNRDTSILLLDEQHSGIVNSNNANNNNNPPQHVIVGSGSLRNSISPISTSPTASGHKSQVVVNLDHPNSTQTISSLQRNNVKNSSTNSNRSQTNVLTTSSIGNNNIIKSGDNGKIFKSTTVASNNNRKYKFNLLKLSSSSSRAERSTRNRLLIVAICLIIFGIAIGAFIVHLSGIYHCNPDSIGM